LFSSRYNEPSCKAGDIDLPSLIKSSAPNWLQKLGFKTYFLSGGDWDYDNMGNAFLSHGFDFARDAYRHWSKVGRGWPFTNRDYDDRQLFADAAKCLAEAGGQRFFLMLWTYDSHIPYRKVPCGEVFNDREFPPLLRASPDYRLMPNQATYPERIGDFRRFLATIRQADDLIASLCSELKRLGLADSTLLVITGDHGDAFGEHGWFCHGHALFEEDVHVPMIFVSPRIKEAGMNADIVGSHVDLWPTLADLCDIPLNPLWQGRSLLSGQEDRRAYFYRPGAIGIREGRYKYVWDYFVGREYLFDLLSDPQEKANVSASHPDLCLTLRRRVRAYSEFQSRAVSSEPARRQTQ
jgi:arylsulfatase A-like enzyme